MIGLEQLKSAASAANNDISRILKNIDFFDKNFDFFDKKGKAKGKKARSKTSCPTCGANQDDREQVVLDVVPCFAINKLVQLLIPEITCGV